MRCVEIQQKMNEILQKEEKSEKDLQLLQELTQEYNENCLDNSTEWKDNDADLSLDIDDSIDNSSDDGIDNSSDDGSDDKSSGWFFSWLSDLFSSDDNDDKWWFDSSNDSGWFDTSDSGWDSGWDGGWDGD